MDSRVSVTASFGSLVERKSSRELVERRREINEELCKYELGKNPRNTILSKGNEFALIAMN